MKEEEKEAVSDYKEKEKQREESLRGKGGGCGIRQGDRKVKVRRGRDEGRGAVKEAIEISERKL